MDYTNGVYEKLRFPGPDVERYRIEYSFEGGQRGGHYIVSTSLKNAIETMLRMIEGWNTGQNLVGVSGRLETYG